MPDTFQEERSWANDDALEIMCVWLVVLAKSQDAKDWLKDSSIVKGRMEPFHLGDCPR